MCEVVLVSGCGSERGKGKGKVSGLCETFRVGWSMMVGLDSFFLEKESRGRRLKCRWRLCFFFFFSLMKICRVRFFCLCGIWGGEVR